MTKEEAYQLMLTGKKVRHEYYSDGEYVMLDANRHLKTEDGCTHGNRFDEFWTRYQKWEDGWEEYVEN